MLPDRSIIDKILYIHSVGSTFSVRAQIFTCVVASKVIQFGCQKHIA